MNKSEKFWDKLSGKYDKRAQKLGDQIYIKTVEKTKRHLNFNDIVLDYACGTGIITNEFSDNVKEIHAIDISSGMIDVAKRKAGERNIKNINFTKSTIFDERYKKESYHVILAFNILHLLEETKEAMQRINELLKPGGLFVSATACLGEGKSCVIGSLLFLLSKIGIIPYLKVLKNSELESLIVQRNFTIVEAEILKKFPSNYFIVAKKI